jgi:hypothetical protein
MKAYSDITVARDIWTKWARRLSWWLLAGMMLHGGLGFAILAFRFAGWTPPPLTIVATGILCFCVTTFALCCAAAMMRNHDRILSYRHTYGVD